MTRVRRTAFALFGLFLFFFWTPLYLLHTLWCRYVFRQNIPVASNFVKEVYANVLTTVGEALKVLLPEAVSVEEEVRSLTDEAFAEVAQKADLELDPVYDRMRRFYIGKKDGNVTGYAVQDVVPGKWGPIYYMLAIEPDGRVRDVIVLEYQERRGRPVAKRRFLKQFFGKSTRDALRVMKDIRGVTGASISSNGMANGIRKMLHIFRIFYGQN